LGTASSTAVSGINKDGLGVGLGTSFAAYGAFGPLGPFGGKYAVDGASLDVAGTGFSVGAFIATVTGKIIDLVTTSLLASAASLGAGGPVVPFVHAVDGARVGVAVLFGLEGLAWNTTTRGGGGNGACALLDATTALLITFSP